MSVNTSLIAAQVSTEVISDNNGRGVTFIELIPVIVAAIQSLIQSFKDCRNPPAPVETSVQSYVQDNFNARTGKYSSLLMARTKLKIRKEHQKQNPRSRMSEADLNQTAIGILDRARLGEVSELKAVCEECLCQPNCVDPELV